MEKIFVDLGKDSYTIEIAPHSWTGFGKKIRELARGNKAAVITDRTVDGLYGADLEQQLRAEGFQVRRLVMEPGEVQEPGRQCRQQDYGIGQDGDW